MASRPISPAEPSKKHPSPIQPNAHPYAIKTTSSALLSRSNSSPHSAHHTRHHYIPFSPSRVQTGSRVRHRHSSSLSSVEGEMRAGGRTAPALSIAEAPHDNTSTSSAHADELKLTPRVRRSETLPGSAMEQHNYDQQCKPNHEQDSRPELYAGLPLDPKQWNTDQLATYLETFLWSGNTDGDKHDAVLVGILEHVRTRGITGRELLRLTDADLARTSLSDVQRARLLERSHALRAEGLRGRMYVDSYHSHEISDNSNNTYTQSLRFSTPFHSIRGASMSADDVRLLDDSSGEGVFPPSPVISLRSNIVSNASAQRYKDLARMRMRRRGKVKGLIETWERTSTSGSECSASEDSVSGSEAESESGTNQELESMSDAKRSPKSPSSLPFAPSHNEPSNDICSSMGDSKVVLQEQPLSTPPPPPYTHLHATPEVDEEGEPSIEELLESSCIPLRGARAWEADFGLGETVKHIPILVPASDDAGRVSPMEPDASRLKNDVQQTRGNSVRSKASGPRGSVRSKGKNTKTQRVVSAIFTGSPADVMSNNVGDETVIVDHHRRASSVNGVVCDEDSNGQDNSLRALEESIGEMRVQMGVFRLRLEKIEADTTRREVELEPVQYSDSARPSESELRQRRLQAKGVDETTAARRDGTFADSFKNRGDLEGWKTMSLGDFARAVVAKAMGRLFPFGHLGAPAIQSQDTTQTHTGSYPEVTDGCLSPTKRSGQLRVVRMSCSILLVSFATCAAVLRRVGFGRWVRRP